MQTKAIVSVEVVAPQGKVTMKHNLFLHSSTEGMLSAFFGAIGQKKKGSPLQMNWNTITGARGVCKVGIRTYNGNQYNEIKSMYYPEDVNPDHVLNRNSTTSTTIPTNSTSTTTNSTMAGGAF